MRDSSFMRSLLAVSILATACWAMPTLAVMPSDVATMLERAHGEIKVWKAIEVTKPGIYEKDGLTFSFVKVAQKPGELPDHLKARAEAVAIEQLLSDYADRFFSGESAVAQVTRFGMVKHKLLTFKGRFVSTECTEGVCQIVFCTSTTEVQTEPTPSQKISIEERTLKAFRADPMASSALFEALGMPDLALLTEVRGLPKAFSNVRSSMAPTPKRVQEMVKFYEARSTYLDKAIQKNPNFEALVAISSASDPSEAFSTLLQTRQIPLRQWKTHRPVLLQAAQCQGFAVVDDQGNSTSPLIMPFIKDRFAQGKDLQLVTALLEDAVEASPVNAEAWEYLAEAYRVAGQTDASLICARVWCVLSTDPSASLKYILSNFGSTSLSKDLASLL